MKTIDNYINERLNPRHLGKASEFPVKGTFNEVIKFLEDEGFHELEKNKYHIGNPHEAVRAFDKEHGALFYTRGDVEIQFVRFANTSKSNISKSNPMYEIWWNGDRPYKYQISYSDIYTQEIKTPEEFLRKMIF